MRWTMAVAVVLWAVPVAAQDLVLARQGDAVFAVEGAGEGRLDFTLSVGVLAGETRCAEGVVDCLTITGRAEGAGGVYRFRDDDIASGFTVTETATGYAISAVEGDFDAGTANAANVAAIAGEYGRETAAMTLPDARPANLVTPSGNIECALMDAGGTELRCDMAQLTPSFTAQPEDCPVDWGNAFGLTETGAPEVLCHGDTILSESRRVLDYGQSTSFGVFTCSSAKTGLTCSNPAGRGFTLSKAAQVFF